MKKGIIVLLITVLAAGMAFAGFNGSASINFGYNLDNNGFGFTNKSGVSQYSFEFAIDSQASPESEHQTDIWAEIAGDAYASIVSDTENGVDPVLDYDWEITTANIHIYDVTVGILGPKSAYDYASSWTKTKGKANYDFANATDFENAAGGFNVSYKGYTVSLALNNAYTAAKDEVPAGKDSYADPVIVFVSTKDYDKLEGDAKTAFDKSHEVITTGLPENARTDGKYYWYIEKTAGSKKENAVPASTKLTLFANAETKAFELTDGMTLQAAVNFLMEGDSKVAGAALKYNYKADKLTVGLASDFQFAFGDKAMALDAKLNAKYDFVSADVYFGANGLGSKSAEYVLEAKASAKIPAGEKVTINVSVEADDLLLKTEDALKNAKYTASLGATVDKLTATVKATWNADIDKKDKETYKGLSIVPSVTYKADIVTVSASATIALKNDANKLAYYGVKPSVSVSTSSLIENCTLALAWSGANFVKENALNPASKGSVNASATISF